MKFPFSRKPRQNGYKIADAYEGLRNQALTFNPDDLHLGRADKQKVWGVLMETGHEKAVATLVAMADNTASLYFSNGGGIIGSGQHEGPAKAAQLLVSEASQFVNDCELIENYPLPEPGRTRFYLLTYNGIFSTEASEEDFGNKRHKLSPLFHLAHDLISEIRIIDRKQ
ncbi:MAG: hypothetical protein ABI210_12290 [Abditibacteriaceae bacterium]